MSYRNLHVVTDELTLHGLRDGSHAAALAASPGDAGSWCSAAWLSSGSGWGCPQASLGEKSGQGSLACLSREWETFAFTM